MGLDDAAITHTDRQAAVSHAIQNQPRNALVLSVTATATPKIVGATALASAQFSVTATGTPSLEATARAFASLSVGAASTPTIADATSRATPSVSVQATGTPNIAAVTRKPGPGAENLQLLLDYENWTAGDPLPNVYPDNSGIDSLTDNNTVGEETASPLVGSKSGFYDKANNEYHSKPRSELPNEEGKILYIAAFGRIQNDPSSNDNSIIGTSDGGGVGGFSLINNNGELQFFIEGNGSSTNPKGGNLNSNTNYFFEGYFDGSEVVVRIDDTTVGSALRSSDMGKGEADLTIGKEDIFSLLWDGSLDMILWEMLDPANGSLFWPNHSTWLYNGGAGRTADEILNYDP